MSENKEKKDSYAIGQMFSTIIENGFLGFLPLFLLGLEVFAVNAESSMVAQLMPYMEGMYWKAFVYTGAGFGAGVWMSSALSRGIQYHQAIAVVANQRYMNNNTYQTDFIKNLTGKRNRELTTALFCFFVAAASHLATIGFVTAAFDNEETLKILKMEGVGEVPATFAIYVTTVGFLLDILLGFASTSKVDIIACEPKYTTEKQIFENYLETIKSQNKSFEKLKESKQSLLVANQFRNYTVDADEVPKENKKDSSKGKENKNNNNNNNNRNNNRNNRRDNNRRERVQVPETPSDPGAFIVEVFGNEYKQKDIEEALEKVSESDFAQYAEELSDSISQLKEIVSQNEDDLDDGAKRRLRASKNTHKNNLRSILEKLGVKKGNRRNNRRGGG